MKSNISPFNVVDNTGKNQTINTIVLTNFCGYDFTEIAKGVIEYALGFSDNDKFIPVQNCSIEIPKEVLDKWSNDDNVILQYIITQKNY